MSEYQKWVQQQNSIDPMYREPNPNSFSPKYGETSGELEKKIQLWIEEAYQVFSLPVNCTWEWNYRAINTAGKAYCKQNRIVLSRRFFEQVDENMQRITVIHEACHLLAYRLHSDRGHGKYWKSFMIKCGLKPERCHSIDFNSHKKQSVECKCGIIKIGPTRYKRLLKQNRRYFCRKCGEFLRPLGGS